MNHAQRIRELQEEEDLLEKFEDFKMTCFGLGLVFMGCLIISLIK